MSKQENQVSSILKTLFKDAKEQVDLSVITKNPIMKGIRVDFWIPSKNTIVEVHGIQHYKESGFGKNKVDTLTQFNMQMNRDAKLSQACEKYDIKLVEIPYTENITMAYILREVSF